MAIAVGGAEEYTMDSVLTQCMVPRNARGGVRAYVSDSGANLTYSRSIIAGHGRVEVFAEKPEQKE